MTWTRLPGSYESVSSYARAVQTCPLRRTEPTSSSLEIRSRTTAVSPTSAAVPVRSCGGMLTWRRAMGRTIASSSRELARNAANWPIAPTPAASRSAAAIAPTANGARKKLSDATSPAARMTARITQKTHGSMYLHGRCLREQCAGEVVGVERTQIVELLADADELHRDAQFAGDGEGDPALRGAVELRQHDAVDGHDLGEELGLPQAVLAGRGVDGEQRLVRRAGQLLVDDPADLAQLGHERVLRVQAPGGVDDDDVDAHLAPAADRLERHRAWVGALAVGLDDLAARALGPAGQLLDRRGAEPVGRAEQDRLAELALQVPRQLADRGRLARAVDADGHDDRRIAPQVDPVRALLLGPCDVGEELHEAPAERLAALEPAVAGLLLELADDACGRRRPDVGHDQRLLQALPGLLVDVPGEQRRLDLGAQGTAGLREVLAQAAEEAAAARGLLLGGRRRDAARAAGGDEEIGPVAGHERPATIAVSRPARSPDRTAGRVGRSATRTRSSPRPWRRPPRRPGCAPGPTPSSTRSAARCGSARGWTCPERSAGSR